MLVDTHCMKCGKKAKIQLQKLTKTQPEVCPACGGNFAEDHLKELIAASRIELKRSPMAKMTIPMSLGELAIGVAICGAIGFAAGNITANNRIDECVENAEQSAWNGTATAQAYYFAICVKPREYDPMYNYNRFKGK